MSFLYSDLKDSSMYKSPWQFLGALLLFALAAVALWYGIKIYFQLLPLAEDPIADEGDVGPVDEVVRQDMLAPRDDSMAEGTEDETEPAEDRVRESSLAPRKPSSEPEDNEPIPTDVRRGYLE